jgi:hypothetical protein
MFNKDMDVSTIEQEAMEFAEFLTWYKGLTTAASANGCQDLTTFCVTFLVQGNSTIAEVWRTDGPKILKPNFRRVRITDVCPLVSGPVTVTYTV